VWTKGNLMRKINVFCLILWNLYMFIFC
jgi:hypothetical protein